MKKLIHKFQVIFRYLIGKPIDKKSYTFTSNLRIGKLPVGDWRFLSTTITIDELHNYWLEDTHIITKKNDKRKLFAGPLLDIQISNVKAYNKVLSKKEIEKL